MNAAIAAAEYAVQLAKQADEHFHRITGAVDEFLHNQLAKAEAFLARLKQIRDGLSASSESGLSADAQAEVDAACGAVAEAA